MAEIQARGIRLPDDMKVIGINNSSICANVSPRLTSVDFRLNDLGDLLIRHLIRRCEEPALPREDIILPVTIAERNSCQPRQFPGENRSNRQKFQKLTK